MKKPLRSSTIVALLFFTWLRNEAGAQCTNATINWDNLKYLVTTGSYSTFVTNAMATTQRFAIGVNAVTITFSGSITNNGESTQNTADAGADLFYSAVPSAGNTATITLTFDAEVTNLAFSIYDIDRRQIVAVNGKNASNADITTTITKRSGTVLTLSPVSGVGTNPTATAANISVSDNNHDGTIDVTMTAAVKTVTLSISNSGASSSDELYISDITACVTGSFPTSYYIVSKPFTGMPGYVLTVVNNNVYFTNTANGVSRLLFTDPGHTNINSLAYDPYNRFVYYTFSLTSSPSTDKALKKYDVNTGTISTLLADVTTLGLPVFNSGVESGAAAFYNGSLYLGIEGYNSSSGNRKSMVWRIDFNGSNVPYRASQVYAIAAEDAASSILHDWSDIGISNGVLYDFDGASTGADFYVYNMQTEVSTNYVPASGVIGRQVSVGWDEKIYNVDGTITQYNGTNGHTGSTYTITSTPAIPGGGSWGDAAEAYRPFLDFGDAPATYDPASGDPAVHDSSGTTLRLGANINVEWLKRGTTSTEDNYEDGLATVPILNPGATTYQAQVSVYNNTGSNATVCAWLDYNGNGVFNTGEGISVTVTSSASTQSVNLYWTGVSTPLSNGSYTYLRIRVTSASNGMTTSNPTGFFANGEVEDYRVLVDNFPLAVTMLSFDVKKIGNSKAGLSWKVAEDPALVAYQVQKSKDGTHWDQFAFVAASHSNETKNYTLTDDQLYKGITYYRIRVNDNTANGKYSEIRSVRVDDFDALVTVSPNPASYQTTININNSIANETVWIKILGMQGNEMYSEKILASPGNNSIHLSIPASWSTGIYMVQIRKENDLAVRKLVIQR